jgi:hypothetical protein
MTVWHTVDFSLWQSTEHIVAEAHGRAKLLTSWPENGREKKKLESHSPLSGPKDFPVAPTS